MNLTDATGQELRQLLDSSRRRGDATLSYRILEEMAARRKGPAERTLFKGRRAAGARAPEPRHVEMDFSDQLEADEIPPRPSIRFPAQPGSMAAILEADPGEAGPAPDPERPLSLAPTPPQEPPPSRRDRPARRGLPLLVAAGFVLGVGLGVVVGWGAALVANPPAAAAAPVTAQAPAPAPIQTAALAIPAAPDLAPVAEETAPEAVTDPAPEPPAAEPEAEATEQLEVLPPPPPPPPEPRPESRKIRADDACATQPSPADRAICGDPKLQRLQGELRRAYAEALAAHEDRALLRERQLAWRDARNTVADPDRLARLYQARIRKLDAAAAQARARH